MLAIGGGLSDGSPAAASDRPPRLILIWLYLYVASHVRKNMRAFFLAFRKRLSSVSSAPFLFSLAAYVENRSRSVQAARLYSSIPAAMHDPIGTISAPLPLSR